jgi:hypothetical protein
VVRVRTKGDSVVRTIGLVIGFGFGFVAVAHAGEGRIEINQTCAVAGCGSGDSAGFPVSFSSGGSFVLTSDLVPPDANTTGVVIPAGSTLDLNGFTIRGPADCTGAPATCVGTGSGSGVSAGVGSTVRNGTITGMGATGISAQQPVRVIDVDVIGNGGVGINASSSQGTLIRGCRVMRNGGDGIDLGAGSPKGSLVENSVIYGNTGIGVDARGVLLLGNIIDSNGGVAINANVGNGEAAYGHNSIRSNNGGGAQVSGGQSIGDNICVNSAC